MDIKVKYHDQNMPAILQEKRGNWIDLCVTGVSRVVRYVDGSSKTFATPRTEDGQGWKISINENYILSFGVSIWFPETHEAFLLPRSSTYKRYGLTMPHSMGVIDQTYCGDEDIWILACKATRSAFLPLYARVAQFRLLSRMPKITIHSVDHMEQPSRGGYGSTGI